MGKKTQYRKRRLGKMLKQSRNMPALARIRTHRRLQQNRFKRSWRQTKMHIEDE